MTGCSAEEVTRLLAELQSSGVFSCTDDGVIYCRRMIREEGKREKCGEAGRKGGGNPTFKGRDKGGGKGGGKGESKLPEARGHLTSSTKKSGAEPPAEEEPRKAKKTNPNHHPALLFFCSEWEKRHGGKYPFAQGKDADAVAFILAAVGNDLDKFRALVGRFLADPDAFVKSNGYDLGTFRMKLPRWLAAPTQRGDKFTPPPTFPTQPPRSEVS